MTCVSCVLPIICLPIGRSRSLWTLYFSSSSVVSHAFSVLCAHYVPYNIQHFGIIFTPKATLVPNFICVAPSIADLARREKLHTQSLTHSPSLFDFLGTKAFALENPYKFPSSSGMAERPCEFGDFKKVRVNGGTNNHSLKDSHKCLHCCWQTCIIWEWNHLFYSA